MAGRPDTDVEIRSREDLCDWLAANHATAGTCWLVTWKQPSPFHVSVGEVVSELLCWGWVDSVTRGVDAERSSVRISPRAPGSAWSAVNKAKVEENRKLGLMQPAGEAAIARAMENGMWSFLDDVERLDVPDDLAAALGGARVVWEDYPRSVKRGTLEWIKTAKREATRAARIESVVERARAGERPAIFDRPKKDS